MKYHTRNHMEQMTHKISFFFFFFFFASVLGRAFNISISLLISAGYHIVLLIIGTVLCNRALELFSSSLTETLYVLTTFPSSF